MLNENEIIDAVCRHFEAEGLVIKERSYTWQQGVDIVAEHPTGWRYVVEAKGATSSKEKTQRFRKRFSSAQACSHVAKAVYTAAALRDKSRHSDAPTVVGIALPDDQRHRLLVMDVEGALKSMSIEVLFVSADGAVRYAWWMPHLRKQTRPEKTAVVSTN